MENCIQAIRQHTEAVKKRVPAQQLLTWKPQEAARPWQKRDSYAARNLCRDLLEQVLADMQETYPRGPMRQHT